MDIGGGDDDEEEEISPDFGLIWRMARDATWANQVLESRSNRKVGQYLLLEKLGNDEEEFESDDEMKDEVEDNDDFTMVRIYI